MKPSEMCALNIGPVALLLPLELGNEIFNKLNDPVFLMPDSVIGYKPPLPGTTFLRVSVEHIPLVTLAKMQLGV